MASEAVGARWYPLVMHAMASGYSRMLALAYFNMYSALCQTRFLSVADHGHTFLMYLTDENVPKEVGNAIELETTLPTSNTGSQQLLGRTVQSLNAVSSVSYFSRPHSQAHPSSSSFGATNLGPPITRQQISLPNFFSLKEQHPSLRPQPNASTSYQPEIYFMRMYDTRRDWMT